MSKCARPVYPANSPIYQVGVGEGIFNGVPGADDGAFFQRRFADSF